MGYNYFFVYGKELEEVAWGEVYPKKDGIDGVNADSFDVGLDFGGGADIVDERVYDVKTGILECTLSDVSREGLEELLRGTNL